MVTETTETEFEALGRALGTPVSVRPGGPATDRLTPVGVEDAQLRSLSAVHGLGAFPYHTDAAHHRLPPRYLVMRLADGACSETPTLLVDVDAMALGADEVRSLSRETWLVRGGFGRTFYAPVLDRARCLVRFDPGCMSQPSGTRLTGQGILEQRLKDSSAVEIHWNPGTTLVADNWRVLHSRPAVVRGPQRVLQRTLAT